MVLSPEIPWHILAGTNQQGSDVLSDCLSE